MDAVGQPLFAGTRLSLQQDIIIRPRNPCGFMLQCQEFCCFPHHAVQAVPAAVTGGVGNGSFQVLNRHGQDDSPFHIIANLHRQCRRYIFIGPVLGDPGNFPAIDRFSGQGLPYRDMFIIQEYICQSVFPVQTFFAFFVTILYLFFPVQPVHADRQLVHDHLLHIPVDQHLQMPFHGVFHGQQQRQQQVIGQFPLIHGAERQNIANFPLHADRGAAGIPIMAFPDPHLRPEHQKRHIVLPGNAYAGSPYVAFQYPHPLDIFNDTLEKRHGIILDHIALVIDQQHTQVMGIKMLFVLFIQPVHIFHNMGVCFLMFDDLFPGKTVDPGHHFVRQVKGPAALPGFCHPGMYIGIDDTVIHELIVVHRQFFFISFFTNHHRCPLSLFYLFQRSLPVKIRRAV